MLEILHSGLSTSYARQPRAVLVVICESVLRRSQKSADLPSAKGEKGLPLVLSREEVGRLLESAPGFMGEALLAVI